jgi:hypothetical protein
VFRADLAWAGPLIGVAALALRTYLKGSTTMAKDEHKLDLQTQLDLLWECRSEVLDYVLMHDCALRDLFLNALLVVGVSPDQWVLGALAGDRDVAEC